MTLEFASGNLVFSTMGSTRISLPMVTELQSLAVLVLGPPLDACCKFFEEKSFTFEVLNID